MCIYIYIRNQELASPSCSVMLTSSIFLAMSFDQQYFINTHSCTVMLVSPVLGKHAQYIAMHVNSAGNIHTTLTCSAFTDAES